MGWYLMVPPPLSHSPKNGQIVPLSQWTKAGAFQSEESCDAKRAVLSKLDPAERNRGRPAEQVYDAHVSRPKSRASSNETPPCRCRRAREVVSDTGAAS
jgi:hypothetical protein